MRALLFQVAALAFGASATFHATAVASPSIARLEYAATYPAWRHVVWIGIDASLAFLLLRRPRWLVWVFGLLTAQVLNSHGRGAWQMWSNGHGLDWISVAVVVAVPTITWMLIIERRSGVTPTAG